MQRLSLENIEWLCRQHHLMVDKRRTARATQLFIERFPGEWKDVHDQILAEVKADPSPKHSIKQRVQRKSTNPGKKLTATRADAVRKLKADDWPNTDLAELFSVSPATISRVMSGSIFREAPC